MATVRDILTRALYRAGVVAMGVTPKAKEMDDGLFVVQSFYDNLFQGQFFGKMIEVYKTSDYTASEFEKVFITSGTVTLPTTIVDGSDTRTPLDLAPITVIDGSRINYIWDDEWVSLTGIALDDAAPLATRGQDGLACAIAMEWAETFGASLTPSGALKGERFKSSLMRLQDITFESALTNNHSSAWWPS